MCEKHTFSSSLLKMHGFCARNLCTVHRPHLLIMRICKKTFLEVGIIS